MKKIITVLLPAVILLFSIKNIQAQAFQKGNINLDVGFGIGAYATVTEFDIPGFTFFGVQVPPSTLREEDGAASFMMPITFEYGISNRIGLGAQIGFSNYFVDNKDSTETLESVKSTDFAILVNFHLLKLNRNDLFVGVAIGGSSINWLDLDGSQLKGSGTLFKLHLSDRVYFSDHIGILFNIGYTVYNFNEIKSSVDADLTTLNWKAGGLNFGTGLAVKF